jgi:hypothetical protein
LPRREVFACAIRKPALTGALDPTVSATGLATTGCAPRGRGLARTVRSGQVLRIVLTGKVWLVGEFDRRRNGTGPGAREPSPPRGRGR